MLDGGGLGEARVGPAELLWNVRVELCEALHMHFVDNGVAPAGAQRAVATNRSHRAPRLTAASNSPNQCRCALGRQDQRGRKSLVELNFAIDRSGVGVKGAACRGWKRRPFCWIHTGRTPGISVFPP